MNQCIIAIIDGYCFFEFQSIHVDKARQENAWIGNMPCWATQWIVVSLLMVPLFWTTDLDLIDSFHHPYPHHYHCSNSLSSTLRHIKYNQGTLDIITNGANVIGNC